MKYLYIVSSLFVFFTFSSVVSQSADSLKCKDSVLIQTGVRAVVPQLDYINKTINGISFADPDAVYIDGVRVFNSAPSICIWAGKSNDTMWFSDRSTENKFVSEADQEHIGIRKPVDFNLFFTRPMRQNEIATYIDGVRLIQP